MPKPKVPSDLDQDGKVVGYRDQWLRDNIDALRPRPPAPAPSPTRRWAEGWADTRQDDEDRPLVKVILFLTVLLGSSLISCTLWLAAVVVTVKAATRWGLLP